MKLILALSTIGLATAVPARTPNQQLQAALTNCEYPDKLASGADVKEFAQCFYGQSDLDETIVEKTAPYKNLAERLSKIYEKTANNPDLMQKRVKAVLIKNANLFGMEKKEAMKQWNGSEKQIMELVNTIDIASIETYLNTNVGAISDEVEAKINAELDPVLKENEEWVNIASDLWAAFSKTETGQAVNGKIDEAEALLNENDGKTLTELAKEAAEYINNQYNVEGQVKDIKSDAEAYIADFWRWYGFVSVDNIMNSYLWLPKLVQSLLILKFESFCV